MLFDPAYLQPGVLAQLADNPPDWLAEARYTAWEVVGDFIDAYDLGESALARQRAVEAGSPKRDLHLINEAISAAVNNGSIEHAEGLISQVRSGHSLLAAARACIADDPAAVGKAVRASGLHESDDADLALVCVHMLRWSYRRLGRIDAEREVLREANKRFPDRAWLLLVQAKTTFDIAHRAETYTPAGRDLLTETAELALRARDLFRKWDGPSRQAVVVAMRAFLGLDDPQRAADLAVLPPEGEAIESEANASAVQQRLATALLWLDRASEIDTLQLENIDPAEEALIYAQQAHRDGDPAALSRMHRAVRAAVESGDEASLHKALISLADLGEVDEEAMASCSEAYIALCRGMAALNQGNFTKAVDVLAPHRSELPFHAECLAQAQFQAGSADEAVKTLTDAIEHFRDNSLYESLIRILFEQDRLEDAVIKVDTSVAGLGVLVDLDVVRMGRVFGSVLVADELTADARMAVESAKRSVAGFVAYDPGLGRVIARTFDERQKAETQRKAERVLDVLQVWQSVRSGPLPLLEDTREDVCRPWDASVRLALSRSCPLWCDDLALRRLAVSQGIATFSTWALYETLINYAGGDGLPVSTDMKMRLLRAGIADVPISLGEIEQAAEDSGEPASAVNLFLRRPVIWDSDLQEALAWYLKRFRMLIGGPHRQRAPELLRAACHGLAAACDTITSQPVVGRILAGSVFIACDPTMTPTLLAAARYATGELEPVDRPDPLPESVKQLLEFIEEAALEPDQAARIVTTLFSQAEPADRQTVTLTLLDER